MRLREHIAIGILFSLALYPIIGNYALLVFFSSILVDIDHVRLIIREKAYTLPAISRTLYAYDDLWLAQPARAYRGEYFLLHTVEFNLVLFAISYAFAPLIYVCLGFALHIISDILYDLHRKRPLLRWLLLSYNLYLLRSEQPACIQKT